MKDIAYLFVLRALSSDLASDDKCDKINLFICRLSEGLFPINVRKTIEENNITVTYKDKIFSLNKSDHADILFNNINELYKSIYHQK